MTHYLLDSDIASYLADQNHPAHNRVARRLSQIGGNDVVYLSVISLYEMYFSVENARGNDDKYQAFLTATQSLSRSFPSLPLSENGAQVYGRIKASYKELTGISPKALRRHNLDLILASTAVEKGAILVSNDRLFGKLVQLESNLRLENWAED